MKFALLALVVLASVLNTVQSGSNSTLHKVLERPFFSMVVVFAVAFASSLVGWIVSGARTPSAMSIGQVPWWAWIGGLLGAVYIFAMMLAADRLGAALFMGITVSLGVITSLIMDHFGLMGFEVHKAGIPRLLGGALMLSGVMLIAKY